ncbi:MAG: hypothetical protein IT379_21415, partial [Deltaproteobacteria bacterium]|nr:hypothetical protein [Deltaproteobacteria bacterium]
GTGSSWRDIAYDLDGRCTSSESDFEDLECAPPPGFAPADDGPNGVDNTLGQTFWPLLTIVDPDYEAAIDRDMEDGIFGVLIRVAEWNGTGNDPVVDVAIVDALRGFAQGQDPMGTNPLEPPAWDGTDEWLATSRSFVAGDSERPLARDTAAYVVDGLIVAHPRDGSEVRISAQTTLTIKVTRGVLTARLTDGNRALGDVIFAGRMALDDVYDTLPRLDICAGSMRHTAITEALRRAADLTTGGEATPMLLCEAISVGIAFDGTLANVADVVEARPERDLCDGGEEHICETTCPTAEDGICDDGGEHSRRITCELGTDCGDCLPRPG